MKEKMSNLNFPNSLTIFRIALIPIFIVVYYSPLQYHHELSALIFMMASLTDWLDGFVARRLNQVTNFGAFLDPIADKLIVVLALMLLLGEYDTFWITVPAFIIVSRELTISGLREWMARLGRSEVVAVTKLGKIKTALQMLAIIILLSQNPNMSTQLINFGVLLLCISTVFTIWTSVCYINQAFGVVLKQTVN